MYMYSIYISTQCNMYTLYTHGIVCLYMVDTLELGTAPPEENPAYALQPARQECIPVDHCRSLLLVFRLVWWI